MSRVLAVIVCSVGAFGLARTVSASEYCVSCTGPDVAYRCAIDGTPDGPGTDPRAQLLCITKLAQAGGHESCSVRRTSEYPCPGVLRVINSPLEGSPPPEPAGPPPAQDAGAAPAEGAEPAPAAASDQPPAEDQPPQTVEELAGKTVKNSQEGLKKAGDALTGGAKATGEAVAGTAEKAGSAIGNAAKNTWGCITSLFSNCGGNAEQPGAGGSEGAPAAGESSVPKGGGEPPPAEPAAEPPADNQ